MDHLLPFGEIQTRRVPLFSSQAYDRKDFSTYLHRQGWSQAQVSAPTQHGRSAEDLDGLLQTWLFFGVLYEVYGEAARESEFMNGKFVSTFRLRQHAQRLDSQWAGMDDAAFSMVRQRIARCLNTVDHQLREVAFHEPQVADSRNVLSIAVLCDFVRRQAGLAGHDFSPGFAHTREVRAAMFRAGWCPTTIKSLNAKLDPASFFLCSRLRPPALRRGTTHDRCSGRQCLATQLDETTYRPAHVCAAGDCVEVLADSYKLCSSLRASRIPLAVLETPASGGPTKLRLLRWEPGIRYVAISHVWSDRMGNPVDNALPRCQLQRLQELVDGLYDTNECPVPFWIDTLSCPVTPQDAQNLAIACMRETYADADKVLVLDSWISAARHKGVSDAEVALRILSSTWVRRLWTLQEGILARQLLIQFVDGSVDIDALYSRLKEGSRQREHTLICSAMDDIRTAWKRTNLNSSGLFVDFASSALRYRATSVATDEALCLSTLAQLDMSAILAEEPERRMKRFWSLLPIAARIVFRTGETLHDEGYRWAPRSLLSSQKPRLIDENCTRLSAVFAHDEPFTIYLEDFEPTSTAVFEESVALGRHSAEGLIVELPGMLLGPWTAILGAGFFVADQNGQYYFVGRNQGHTMTEIPSSGDSPVELAILFEKPLDQLINSVDATTTLIISVRRRENEVIYVHIESVGFTMPHSIPQDPAEEDETGIRFIVQMVETCKALFDDAITTEQATGLAAAAVLTSETAGQEPRVVEMNESVLTTNVIKSRAIILKDGEHFFYEGHLTSHHQAWCID